MDLDKLFKSKNFTKALIGIGCVAVLLLVFRAGIAIGFRKANFSYKWGENYHRNFGGPKNGFFENFGRRDFIDSHGVFGQIIKIDTVTGTNGTIIIIKGSDNVEKIVVLGEETTITAMRKNLKKEDLKVGDSIVVIGAPNDSGQIDAKFIRVMPINN